MRKIVLSMLVLAFTFCAVAAAACSDKDNTGGESVRYEFSLDKTSYEAAVGERFTIPQPAVTPALQEGRTISFSVKFGAEDVEKDGNGLGFTPEKAGLYTVSYSIVGALYEPFSVSVTASVKKAATAAPTEVSVNSKGIITFEAEPNREYSLYINNEKKAEIISGQSVAAYIPAGTVTLSVKVEETQSAFASALSEPISVSRRSPVTISMHNGVIDFESVQGESYTLYISGDNKGQITPETDISSHFIAGTNEITVVTDGGEGILASGESNILTVVKHSKIMDLEISEDGTVSFSSRYGFEYELTADGNERGKVKNSDNISSILDELTAGTHRISVKILATGSNCFVDGADEYGNAVEVNKLSAPAAPRVAANKIIFTEVAGETYELFTDNKSAGEIKSGASMVPFYTQNVNMQIALRANKKGFWASDVGAVKTVSVPEKYRAIKGTAQVSYEQSFVYSDKTRLAGAKLSGKTGDIACAEDWTVPFSGSLLKFGYCSLAGSCRMENFAVVVTDVTTDKVLKIIFTSNDDSRRTDSVYVSFEYNGTTSKIYLLTSDMSDSGTGYWGGPQKRIVEIVKTSAGLDFTGTFTDGGWYEIHPEQPDLTGFGQDGVTIGFEFISTETEGNSVIVESIGSHSFLFDVYGEYESAEGQTFTYSDGSAVSGRKITVAENGTTVRIVDEGSITAGGELAKIGFCNVNGNNTIEVFSLIFTSITDPDDKLTVTFNVGNAKASGRVYIKYAYRDAVSEERIVSMDVTDSGNNATFPGQPRFINLFYKSASSSDGSGTLYDLAYNGFTDAWVYGYNGLDLSSLVASGVYADIRFDSITAPSSVIINNIAGNSFVAAQ